MKPRLSFFILIFLILIIAIEVFVYRDIKKDIFQAKGAYEKEKFELNSGLNKTELEHNSDRSFGYTEVLELLNMNSSFKITNIKRKEGAKKELLVQIEFITEERNIESIVSDIYKMENLQGISKLIIKGQDSSNKNIILNGEFKMN